MPIIGHGDIASVLNDRDGALFFASGVSNSSCSDHIQFHRERLMLQDQDKRLCCFYFSSIFAPLKDTPYFRHKLTMEAIVLSQFKNCNIIRLGNITFGTNPHTFINYIKDRISKGLEVKIKNEYRYVIDVTTLLALTDNLPLQGQLTINAFRQMAKVKELIK